MQRFESKPNIWQIMDYQYLNSSKAKLYIIRWIEKFVSVNLSSLDFNSAHQIYILLSFLIKFSCLLGYSTSREVKKKIALSHLLWAVKQ